MAGTLQEFISEVKTRGLAVTNHFQVTMAKPGLSSNADGKLVQLFCEQTVLPGLTYSTQPIRSGGENREVVYDRNFEQITMTFIVDRQMEVKKFFDSWMESIISPTSRIHNYYADYIKDIQVEVYDIASEKMYTVEFREAYPKSIQAINLDNNSKDVMKLQVQFVYKYHINSESAANKEGTDAALMLKILPDQYLSDFTSYQEKVNTVDRSTITTGTGLNSIKNFFGGGGTFGGGGASGTW